MTKRSYNRIGRALSLKKHHAMLTLLELKCPGKNATLQEFENYSSHFDKLLEYNNEISDLLLLVIHSRRDLGMLVKANPTPTFKIVNHKTFEKLMGAKQPKYLYDGKFCKCVSVTKRFNRITHYIYTADVATI